MGRRAEPRGVAEAKLFGAYQRRIDLACQTELVHGDIGQAQPDNGERVNELEAKLSALGGDPAYVLGQVNGRYVNRSKVL